MTLGHGECFSFLLDSVMFFPIHSTIWGNRNLVGFLMEILLGHDYFFVHHRWEKADPQLWHGRPELADNSASVS